MKKIICVSIILSLLTGCASMKAAPLPSCDGLARRPLNPSMWELDKAASPSTTETQQKVESKKS